MKLSRDFMRVYIIPIVLLAGILLAVGFTSFYTTTVRTPSGKTIAADWPKDFTLAFSEYIVFTDGVPSVTDAGEKLLTDNGLWLQILNASGAEAYSYCKPAGTKTFYRPYDLLALYQYGESDSSVFVSSLSSEGADYTYLIGFPLHISKIVMYVDNARFYSGRALIIGVILLTAILVGTLSVYSYKTFTLSELRRRQDEKAKEEWLINITHDLKTPLAPIRGYAELLTEVENPMGADVRRSGAIILKNTLYAGQLVDDMKLTYQLKSGLLPLNRKAQNLPRFVRETVIDILNTPEYEGRALNFTADREELNCAFDSKLLRRALANIVINALKHNGADTEITVAIASEKDVAVTVADNGVGMTEKELDGLFTRYYRGTSTKVKAEGSGLGMAIARQIVEAHGGTIAADSKVGKGTVVTVTFPEKFKV